ncbi:MAG: DNA/RNA nuclease SfsA [Oleiphilaceae bacterium]|nr:DNA/RNA nuclease SfsA [Oleiphilaceae bacterium]
MRFEGLQEGRFIRRYKRFMVDLELSDGQVLTVHCPNTGAMTGCLQPGAKAFFSTSENQARKYPHTLEWLEFENGSRACINTQRPNALVEEAIRNGVIDELEGYACIKREQRYGEEGSRVDLLLTRHDNDQPDCYVEVKNVTLCEGDLGLFPDAVSIRALKHLRELQWERQRGARAVLVFCVNHTAIRRLSPARKVDLDYSELLGVAAESGVEILAYRTEINRHEIRLVERIPFICV